MEEEAGIKPMEIVIGGASANGMTDFTVYYRQMRQGYGWSVEVRVWVPHNDSISAMEKAALAAAHEHLGRTREAHAEQDPQPAG